MAEAEDVILHAAEQVTAAVGGLWRRHRPAEECRGIALVDVSRRLSVLIQACLGRRWPLLPVDPDAAPNWLARRLRKLPPWVGDGCAQAFSDGRHIFLPRYLQTSGDAPSEDDLLRLMALMLAVRLGRGSVVHCPTHPVARDLFWGVDGAVVEGFLTMEFPGLATAMAAARRFARGSRPSLEALQPRERAVEVMVRRLLETPPGDVRSMCPNVAPALSTAADLAEWAGRVAAQPPFDGIGSYRGVAPVAHWGRPRPDLLQPAAPNERSPGGSRQQRASIRSQQVPHRIEAQETAEDQPNGREGPFLAPHGDPQQSVENPAGLRRPLDQGEEPELEVLAEELARLGQVPCVDSDANVQEILEVEGIRRHRFSLHDAEGLKEPRGVTYPEWDYRAGVYRQRYCALWETAALPGDPQWSVHMLRQHHPLIHEIRRRFEALRPKRRRDTQQLDGAELDLDAYVDDFASRRAGRLPSDRLYLTDRPRRREVAVAFLIDASGSTDAWVSGGRRVLDLEKEATLVFCEALEALGDQYAIYAFASRGVRQVHVRRVKGFTEAYGVVVRQRIAGLHTQAYTRLGAPLRHLTAHLTRQRARLRLLFLLSDGKPNDEDAYEGTYGIEDTRQAVAEARLQDIHLFCLTIGRQGSIDLPHMFGPHSYSILWDITQLPYRLPELYRRLTTGRR
jgi:nitric oxide reductase NorD protein